MDSLESVESVAHGAEPVLYEGHIVRGRIVLSDLISLVEDSSDGSLVVGSDLTSNSVMER